MNLLGIWELERKQIGDYVNLALEVKGNPQKYLHTLDGKTLAMVFEKASTRTRVSFEAGMTQLGGHAIYFDFTASQLSRGETMHDTAKTLGRYVQIIMARLYRHTDLLEIAAHAGVPVINALTDEEHPCQALSDLQTMKEHGKLKAGAKFAFVGDCGFNMANSLMLACTKAGMDVSLVCPKGYPPKEKYLKEAEKFGKVEVCNDPAKGVKDADVVYTDVWISMGMEDEKAERMIVADAPWVFFWHRNDYILRQPWIGNYKAYPIYSMDKGTDIMFLKSKSTTNLEKGYNAARLAFMSP